MAIRSEKKPSSSPPSRPYSPERSYSAEGIKKIGAIVFIIDLATGKLWTIEEKKAKSETGRISGVVSIPMETRKPGEFIIDNVLGALGEFKQLGPNEKLVWLDGQSYKGRFSIGPGVWGDVVLIGLDHRDPENKISEFAGKEVDFIGWQSLHKLLNQTTLRSGLPPILELARAKGWIEGFIEAARSDKSRPRVLTAANEPELRYYLEREINPDYQG
jgi:hypothetical protein